MYYTLLLSLVATEKKIYLIQMFDDMSVQKVKSYTRNIKVLTL